MTDYITPIKEQLDEKMTEVSLLYMTIGTQKDTPRYYNIREIDYESQTLTIGSTQKDRLFFTIDLSDTGIETIQFGKFWQQFKEYRTNFLQENFKTIDTI